MSDAVSTSYLLSYHYMPCSTSKENHTLCLGQNHPAGSEVERGGEWILQFHSLCKPWYLHVFTMFSDVRIGF
jgi:hypothetical protein